MGTGERLEIRRWVQKAIALLESAGTEETLAQIADVSGPFTEGKRYMFALDLDGRLLAHPYNGQLVGRNLADLTDFDGKAFIKKLLTTVKKRGYGYADYTWPLPDSKIVQKKTVFFEQVGGIVLCGGFYAPEEDPLAKQTL